MKVAVRERPACREMRWVVGGGQTRKHPVRKGREADLDTESNEGLLKQGSSCVGKVTGQGRMAWSSETGGRLQQ